MRRFLVVLSACMLLLGMTVPATAATFPDVVSLPDGFFPEGIAIGDGTTFYTGSLVDGAIYRGDLRSGTGDVLVPGVEGSIAVGMDFDRSSGSLYVAGGFLAVVTAYDGDTGAVRGVAAVPPGGFVNDVIVTGNTLYATDSFQQQIYSIPLANDGGFSGDALTIPLTGDFQFEAGQFNANGIEATQNGAIVFVVNSFFGEIYAVDPATGHSTVIDLGGESVNGDGLVLLGRTLYAVVGGQNQVVEIQLSLRTHSGVVVETITDSDFDVPTTAAPFGNSLYVVNAKFNTPAGPDVPYELVRVDR